MQYDQYLITVTAPPSLYDHIIDWLLEFEPPTGFTSFPVNGHSSNPRGLSAQEQVSGSQKQMRFQIHLASADLARFLTRLKSDFANARLHYWVSPVIESGHI